MLTSAASRLGPSRQKLSTAELMQDGAGGEARLATEALPPDGAREVHTAKYIRAQRGARVRVS